MGDTISDILGGGGGTIGRDGEGFSVLLLDHMLALFLFSLEFKFVGSLTGQVGLLPPLWFIIGGRFPNHGGGGCSLKFGAEELTRFGGGG